MLKIAVILLVICVIWRWALGAWPWQMLSSTPNRAQTMKDARKLLNVDRDATREEIVGAHKRLISTVHPDRGGSNAEVHAANDARDLLLGNLPPPPREDKDIND